MQKRKFSEFPKVGDYEGDWVFAGFMQIGMAYAAIFAHKYIKKDTSESEAHSSAKKYGGEIPPKEVALYLFNSEIWAALCSSNHVDKNMEFWSTEGLFSATGYLTKFGFSNIDIGSFGVIGNSLAVKIEAVNGIEKIEKRFIKVDVKKRSLRDRLTQASKTSECKIF